MRTHSPLLLLRLFFLSLFFGNLGSFSGKPKLISGLQYGRITPSKRFFVRIINFSWEDADHVFCGGVIVGDFWVLTTAQCVDGTGPNDVEIETGDFTFPFDRPEIVPVDYIVTHPLFSNSESAGPKYNVALLRTPDRFPNNRICDFCSDEVHSCSLFGVCGFQQYPYQDLSRIREIYQYPLGQAFYQWDQCSEEYMCARSLGLNNQGISEWDRGSPLYLMVRERFDLVPKCVYGITSHQKSVDFGIVSYFVKIDSIIDWIFAVMYSQP